MGTEHKRRLLTVLGHSVLEAAACYPFVLLYMLYAMQAAPWWLLPLIVLLHAGGTLIGIRQARGSKMPVPAALLFAAALLPLAGLGLRHAIPAVALLLLADFRGLIVGRKELWRIMQLNLPLAGLAASLITYAVSSRVEEIEPFRIPLYLLSVLTLVALLVRWNGDRVREASNAQETDRLLLRRILSRNRWMTWMTIAFMLILSLWNGLGQGLAYFRRWLAGMLNGLIGSEPPELTEQPPQAPQQGPLELPPASPSPRWAQIVSQIVFVLLVTAVAAALLLLLYRLLRRWLPERLRAWLARIAQRFRLLREVRSSAVDQGDYVDEVEKIERVPKRQGRLRRRRKDGAAAAGDGDPRRAYENLIRAAIKRGYKFRPSLTPTENGKAISAKADYTGLPVQDVEQVIGSYNHIRYGAEE